MTTGRFIVALSLFAAAGHASVPAPFTDFDRSACRFRQPTAASLAWSMPVRCCMEEYRLPLHASAAKPEPDPTLWQTSLLPASRRRPPTLRTSLTRLLAPAEAQSVPLVAFNTR